MDLASLRLWEAVLESAQAETVEAPSVDLS